MKTFIMDDERLARQELKNLLEDDPRIEIIGESGDPEEAISMIDTLRPELLLLDISMPAMNGFELLEKLEFTPKVIFISAYNDYALEAFKVNALDYLLKPVDPQRLHETLGKVVAAKSPDSPAGRNVLSGKDQVFVKDGEKCWFVELADIRLFESEGNYIRVYFGDNRPLILKSLNNLEERLDPAEFFRVSRKHIVNLRWIEGIENWFNGGLMAKLKGGEQVEISRRQSARFREIMSL